MEELLIFASAIAACHYTLPLEKMLGSAQQCGAAHSVNGCSEGLEEAFGGEYGSTSNASSTCSQPGAHPACKLAESILNTENPLRNVCFCTVLAHNVVPGSLDPWLQPLQLV